MRSWLARAAGAALLAGFAVLVPSSSTTARSATSVATRTHQSALASTPITPNGAWTVYHHDDGHTGYDPTAPSATSVTAGWVSGALDETVYGEPLISGGIVYVATLNNTVYALNQTDGSLVWSRHLRAPQTTGWQCGNVAPQGILGTPVIDLATGRIYVVTLGSDNLYRLEGLNLATGLEELTTVITTMAATGFEWTIQQQRGALAVANGNVYVPFGGRAGDCGPYHGWIFAVPTNGTAVTHYYVTPGQGAGFWTSGGVVVDDSTGKIFDTSGNGTSIGCDANPNDGTPVYENDAVVRLSSTLAREDAFIPQDWQGNWCANDQDLGSASMVLITPTLAFQAGKWGNGFLVNPQALGGLDGQVYPTPKPAPYGPVDVCYGNHIDANFGAYAYAAPYVYLECEGHGLVGLNVTTSPPPAFSNCDATCASPTWSAGGGGTFGPPIVAGGAVWAVSINGGGLSGFDAATGAQIYQSAGFGVTHFSTPSEAGGQIFVSSDNVVRSFNMISGCSSVTFSAAPPSTASIGTTVTLTATASGCPHANPLYQFWMSAPGASTWQIVQAYSASAIFNWDTTGAAAGSYNIVVFARDASSPGTHSSSGGWDAYSPGTYTLTLKQCTGVSFTISPPSSATVGTPVTMNATASGCPDPNPLFQFWMSSPGASTWQIVQPYSTTATFNWITTGAAAGSYNIVVFVRDASSTGAHSSSGGWDAYSPGSYTLTLKQCTGVSFTISPLSSATVGTPVTINATASGCPDPNPLYQFWMSSPGASTWQVVQPYSTSSTYSWTTTGATAGTYNIVVFVRDASSPGAHSSSGGWDAYSPGSYTLTPRQCTGVSFTISPPSSATVGTSITISATASGCTDPNPLYEFWISVPGASTWQVVQPYSTSPSYNWNTTGAARGSYAIVVFVRDASSPGTHSSSGGWDAYAAGYYTLS